MISKAIKLHGIYLLKLAGNREESIARVRLRSQLQG